MQVEQKNIWEDVTRNAKRDNSNRAIAAYQANMPDAGAVAAFGGQEAYMQQKTAVSEAGNIDMATYSNPAKQGQEGKDSSGKNCRAGDFFGTGAQQRNRCSGKYHFHRRFKEDGRGRIFHFRCRQPYHYYRDRQD